jgi:hypothetical protein
MSSKKAAAAFSSRRQIWLEVCRTSLSNMRIYISSYVVYFLHLIIRKPADMQLMCRELALVALLGHAETHCRCQDINPVTAVTCLAY